MRNDGNFKQFSVNLRPRQIEELNAIRSVIKHESNVKFPISELIRDAVDEYLRNTINDSNRRTYMFLKGW